MKFNIQSLVETAVRKGPLADAPRLERKWERFGLLEGLNGTKRSALALMLENQAAHLLQEGNALSMGGAGMASSGQVAGFINVAFPLIRRVFAGLISSEIISVQPMSLPSGLIFYLDYSYGSNVGGDAGTMLDANAQNPTYAYGDSIYNNPRGAGIRSGSLATGGQYDLIGTGFSKVHKSDDTIEADDADLGSWVAGVWTPGAPVADLTDYVGFNARFASYDERLERGLADNEFDFIFLHIPVTEITSKIIGADVESVDQINIYDVGTNPGSVTEWGEKFQGGRGVLNLRRLNKRGNWDGTQFTPDAFNGTHIQFVIRLANAGAPPTLTGESISLSAAIADTLSVNADGSTLTIPSFETDFNIDANPRIPEVDLRVESTNVTATTRKLRARWSPEKAQDVSAYFSIDIEVELTNVLSEMITMDIDREILNDLLTQGNAANLYWSRAPGKMVDMNTGREIMQSGALSPGPMAFVNVQDWYQTLVETISHASNMIYKKTLRGAGNFIVTSPEVCTILEHLVSYKAAYKIDSDGQVKDSMTVGAESAGVLNGRYTVYKDPYFPSNKILVGLKGNTFLESGYVYAPYVPLILTPVIYAQEDFTPRRGIMTRYGKKMLRSDFYAVITVLDLSVI